MASTAVSVTLVVFPVAFAASLVTSVFAHELLELRDPSGDVNGDRMNSVEVSVSTVSSVMTSSNLVEFSVASAALVVFPVSPVSSMVTSSNSVVLPVTSVASITLLGGLRGLGDGLRSLDDFPRTSVTLVVFLETSMTFLGDFPELD